MEWQYAGKSDVGRVRRSNEDSYYADPERGVFLVADGMGGHAAGEVASEIVSETVGPGIGQALEEGLRDEALERRLLDLISESNTGILRRADEEPDKRGMGTTLTVLVLLPEVGRYLIGQVGDSRGYLFRDGELSQITRDHTVVQQQVEQGALTVDEARDHPLSHILTRALGTEEQVDTDIYSDDVQPGDMFVLCSDGLSGMLSDERIAEVLAESGGDVEEAGEELVTSANQAGGQDNVTALVVRVTE